MLFFIALQTLVTKRQKHKRAESTGGGNAGEAGSDEPASGNLAIYPLAIPLLARLLVQYVIDGLTAIGIVTMKTCWLPAIQPR